MFSPKYSPVLWAAPWSRTLTNTDTKCMNSFCSTRKWSRSEETHMNTSVNAFQSLRRQHYLSFSHKPLTSAPVKTTKWSSNKNSYLYTHTHTHTHSCSWQRSAELSNTKCRSSLPPLSLCLYNEQVVIWCMAAISKAASLLVNCLYLL